MGVLLLSQSSDLDQLELGKESLILEATGVLPMMKSTFRDLLALPSYDSTSAVLPHLEWHVKWSRTMEQLSKASG